MKVKAQELQEGDRIDLQVILEDFGLEDEPSSRMFEYEFAKVDWASVENNGTEVYIRNNLWSVYVPYGYEVETFN